MSDALEADIPETIETSTPPGTGDSLSTEAVITDKKAIEEKRQKIVEAISRTAKIQLIKKSRALYWDAAHQTRIADVAPGI